jgi:D,D-heptose 1,7-bisphosphate phosphatase
VTEISGVEETPAVVLVGGRGTRLGLGDLPKPMVDFCGKPLLERIVMGLEQQRIRRFVFLAGHGARKIEEHFGNGERLGVNIEVVREETPLGTAGSFDLVRDRMRTPFLVFYGDVVFDIDVERFLAFAREHGGAGTLYVHPNDHPFDSDLVDIGENGRVSRFVSKPHGENDCGNLVSAAIYYLTPEILEFVPSAPSGPVDWGRDIFPEVVAANRMLYAYRGTEYVKDIGTPDRLTKAKRAFELGRIAERSYARKQRAIFLDRDGVLNEEIDGVFRPKMLKLLPGAGETVKRINDSSFLAICITNQPAVAKGFMTLDDLKRVHWELDAALARSGAFLDDLFFCPHHPERGFQGEVTELKFDCACRKPKPGMLLAAAKRHNIDLSRSYFIGDDMRDMLAGEAAGVACYLVGGDRQKEDKPRFRRADTLSEAVEDVLAREKVSA